MFLKYFLYTQASLAEDTGTNVWTIIRDVFTWVSPKYGVLLATGTVDTEQPPPNTIILTGEVLMNW